MTETILVAYATRAGSTQEVAEAIAETLRECGLEVDFQPAQQVRSLDQYRAVVLGAPLYMFHWHKDARHFLARHREALMQRPVAIFALGPFHDKEEEFQEVRKQLDKELAKFPWLTPRAVTVFGGRFDPQKLTFPYNLMPGLKKMEASDARNWTVIRAWAADLITTFQPVVS
ncbi:MAG: flavodoxin domain-containing protein [Ktedonobacteraceae bacterium]|nr:flavodoxin domain-containing protein [Ktedonobacteraceae bacterium]